MPNLLVTRVNPQTYFGYIVFSFGIKMENLSLKRRAVWGFFGEINKNNIE